MAAACVDDALAVPFAMRFALLKAVRPHEAAEARGAVRAASDAWLALLGRRDASRKDELLVLGELEETVLPAAVSPLRLADFCFGAFSRSGGGSGALLALAGVHTLMLQHGLECADFYERLYSLLTPETLRSRHRSRFLILADRFLTAANLPSHTAAAFAKRMARLALTAPPPGALTAIPFVYNVLRRHPACLVLVQRDRLVASGLDLRGTADAATAPSDAGVDPFVAAEPSTAKSRAMESSLWEVATLKRHYNHAVARMACVFDGGFARPAFDMADFVHTNHAQLRTRKRKRKGKAGKDPSQLLAFRLPEGNAVLTGAARAWSSWQF